MELSLREFWGQYHSWVIGFIVTTVMSYGRFNTPPTSRSSTTWGRYHTLAIVYTSALLGTWVILANTPEIIRALAANKEVPEQFKALDAPVYAAILVVVLAGGVVPFSTLDDKARRFLQDLARIPWEVQRLTAALRARTWLPSVEFQDEIRRILRQAGFAEVDMSFSCDRTPQALWTRVTALKQCIADWEVRHGKFAGYYFANVKAIRQLEEEYEHLAYQAKRVLPKVKVSESIEAGGADEVKEELAQSFVASAERLEKELCETVSRGILTCGLTDRARRTEFERIGFMVNVTPSRLFDDMLGLYLVLVALYVVVMSLAKRPRPWLTGILIATIYMGAVVMAIMFKRWQWARSRDGAVPVTGCAVSAAAAFGFAWVTSFGLAVLLTFDVRESWMLLTGRWWPWAFMSTVVTGVLAYLIEQEDSPRRRWFESGIMAAACGVAAVGVVRLLNDACGQSTCDNPPMWRVVVNAALTGGIIGWCVPMWYRRPQIMITEYRRFRVIVSVKSKPDGGVTATVDLQPPRVASARGERVHLGDEVESASTDDAIAEAVRSARGWIDARPMATLDGRPGLVEANPTRRYTTR